MGEIGGFRTLKEQPTKQLEPTIKLVLDDVVESFQKEEDEVVVLGRGEQEPGGGEGLQQVEKLVGGHHRKALQVRRHCRERLCMVGILF